VNILEIREIMQSDRCQVSMENGIDLRVEWKNERTTNGKKRPSNSTETDAVRWL